MNTTNVFVLMATTSSLLMLVGQAFGGQIGMFLALVMIFGMNFFICWLGVKMSLEMKFSLYHPSVGPKEW